MNSAPIVPQVNRTGTESSDADEENRNLRILSGSNFPSLLFLFEIEMGIWNPKMQNQLDLRNWRQILGNIFYLTPKLQSLQIKGSNWHFQSKWSSRVIMFIAKSSHYPFFQQYVYCHTAFKLKLDIF